MEGYEPTQECKICKGKCSREHGCALAPEDFIYAIKKADAFLPDKSGEEIKKEQILAFLQRPDNLFAIDRQSEGFYYLRMRHKCYTYIGVDAIGECIALTKEGCSLSFFERPKGGRFLKSSKDFCCKQEYTLEMMKKDWAPYQGVLREIWEEYEPKLEKDGTFAACDEAYFQLIRGRGKNND